MNKTLKRFAVAGSILVGSSVGLLNLPWLATHHEQQELTDTARNNRSVPVDVYIRRDKQMQAEIGMTEKMPVVIISHGNTVKSSDYSFVANFLATNGYLVLSIQHDLPGDPPLASVAKQGTSYIPRWGRYMLASANIDFVVNHFKQDMPFADYDRLTLLGHSQGGDDSEFYAKSHPGTVARVITFDNLRMPMDEDVETLSLRGLNGDDFKTDEGVLPCTAPCEKGKVIIKNGETHHTTFSDSGPLAVKKRAIATLWEFMKRPLPKLKGPVGNPLPPSPM